MRRTPMVIAAVVALIAAAGCSAGPVINTEDTPQHMRASAPTAPPSTPSPSNIHLVNAFDFVAHVDSQARYYFTTPSGRWECAILPRVKAGCQSARNWQSGLGIPGEPDEVSDAAGETATPNAIVVDRADDAHFAELEQPEFSLDSGTAKVLQFDEVLAAAGFRCNVQETGVSCLSESTDKGFTFSADGYTFHYTDLP